MAQWDDGSTSNESLPLLHTSPQHNCRKSRPENHATKWGYVKQTLSYILRFLFWSSGYNRHISIISKIYSGTILFLCWYQVIYEIYKTSGCIEFNCHQKNVAIGSTKRLEYASYLSSAIGSACSYTFMLLCLSIMYRQNSNAISPYVALKDMGNSKARIILWTLVTLTLVYIAFILLYVYIETTHPNLDKTSFQRMIRNFSDICEFFTQWVAIVSLFAFSCSTFAIGM